MAKPAPKSTALWIIRKLRRAGYQSLLAGGCVRDMLLGKRSYDYDIATDATPQQVKALFGHVLLIGAKFGAAVVIHRGARVEVTTFRSDLSYSDGRRPDGVEFTSPREDAERRDFTINGMFYDPVSREVVDYVGGRDDLALRVIRCIGSPQRRFDEDYLRMLRAVRFAVRLDFAIDPRTSAAIKRNAPRVAEMSGERIFDELSKMLSAPSASDALTMLAKLNLAKWVLPDVATDESLWRRGMKRVHMVARAGRLTTKLGALLAELPPTAIRKLVRKWGAPNELRDALCFLAANLSAWGSAPEMPLCDFKRLMASEHFDDLMAVWRAQEHLASGKRTFYLRTRRRAKGIATSRVSPRVLITGEDLKAMGVKQGPLFGRMLRAVRDAQLNEEISTRPAALAMAREML